MTQQLRNSTGKHQNKQTMQALVTVLAFVFAISSCCLLTEAARTQHFNNYHLDQEIADSFASRPHRSLLAASSPDAAVVVGKFKAPAPERFQRQRIAKSQKGASQTVSASFRVSDGPIMENNEGGHLASSSQNEKIIHGLNSNSNGPQFGRPRNVSAKIMVSDEGLNYPPSKLSADIHGNVAEIVTAPPEAVESDLFLPPASKLFGR